MTRGPGRRRRPAYNLGYGELISNRVVDAIGDLAGGVRLYDTLPRLEDRGNRE